MELSILELCQKYEQRKKLNPKAESPAREQKHHNNKTDDSTSISKPEKKLGIESGTVLKQVAVFNRTASNNLLSSVIPIQKLQKKSAKDSAEDPTEAFLKEQMALFQQKKRKVLTLTAPYSTGIKLTKMQEDENHLENFQISKTNQKMNPKIHIKLNDKIKQLRCAKSTISETNIKNSLLKQREQDMAILALRSNKVGSIQSNVKSLATELFLTSPQLPKLNRINPPSTEKTENRQQSSIARLRNRGSTLEKNEGNKVEADVETGIAKDYNVILKLLEQLITKQKSELLPVT